MNTFENPDEQNQIGNSLDPDLLRLPTVESGWSVVADAVADNYRQIVERTRQLAAKTQDSANRSDLNWHSDGKSFTVSFGEGPDDTYVSLDVRYYDTEVDDLSASFTMLGDTGLVSAVVTGCSDKTSLITVNDAGAIFAPQESPQQQLSRLTETFLEGLDSESFEQIVVSQRRESVAQRLKGLFQGLHKQ